MKKVILALVFGLTLLLAVPCFADAGDITKAEVKPDVVKYQLDTVRFLVITQTCEVTYRKVDSGENPVNEEVKILFQNVADDPTTPENEEKTEFTQLINAIDSGSSIKQTITNAVKIKLGI